MPVALLIGFSAIVLIAVSMRAIAPRPLRLSSISIEGARPRNHLVNAHAEDIPPGGLTSPAARVRAPDELYSPHKPATVWPGLVLTGAIASAGFAFASAPWSWTFQPDDPVDHHR